MNTLLRVGRGFAIGTIIVFLICTFPSASHATSYPVSLPKAMEKLCRDAATRLHPGEILYVGERALDRKAYFVVLIRGADEKDWLVACDAENASVFRAVALELEVRK